MSMWTSIILRLLLWSYVPFIVLLCGLTLLLAGLLCLLAWEFIGFLRVCAIPLVLIFIALATQLGIVLASFAQQIPPPDDLEYTISDRVLQPLYELVRNVALRWRLTLPDEIRLGAETIAHVYEESDGHRVLVIGGSALAVLTQDALAGVAAHELAHFTAGDTRLSRKAFRRAAVMAEMGYRFNENQWVNLNPLVWMIHLYHWCFQLAWAAHSRQREFAADEYQVMQAGKEIAAAALLRLELLEQMPWTRLDSIARSAAVAHEPVEQIFREQMERGRHVKPHEWDDALRKALRKKPQWLDTHPSLKDRLRAMRIKPKKALQFALKQKGAPARELFSEADWNDIERTMSIELMALYQAAHAAKRELAQIFMGRPIE